MKKSIFLPLIFFLLFQTGCGTNPTLPSTTTSSANTSTSKQTIVVPPASTLPTLKSQTIQLKNGSTFSLNLPDDYHITPANQGYRNLRFMTWSPDGRLFVAEMYNRGDISKGRLLVFENFNEQTKQFEKVTTYLDNLRNPNNVAFYTDPSGTQWLYMALTDKLVRYKYVAGETKPAGQPELLMKFLEQEAEYGPSGPHLTRKVTILPGGHITRTIAIHNNKLYISIGSTCNACDSAITMWPEERYGKIIVMNMDGSNKVNFAYGLRNAVGMTFVGDDLYATDMGVDHLGNDRPDDTLYKIEAGHEHGYGWPYCYESGGSIFLDTSQKWQGAFRELEESKQLDLLCKDIPLSARAFPAHSAPLGLRYFTLEQKFPYLTNTFLVALHGSGTSTLARGYKVVRAALDGTVDDFITGFIQKGKVYGRPVDILPYEDRGFFISDDQMGVLYYVYR